MIFLDWSSAFDRVSHDIVIEKLIKCGISERAQRIIQIILY